MAISRGVSGLSSVDGNGCSTGNIVTGQWLACSSWYSNVGLFRLNLSTRVFTRCCHKEWSGINALLYYGPTIIRNVGLQGDTVTLIVSGGIGIVQFLAVIPAIVYIDQLGRIFTSVLSFHLLTVPCVNPGRKPLLRGARRGHSQGRINPKRMLLQVAAC